MEHIFVTYRPVGGTFKTQYHMSLNYIDKQGRHHIIDGGPEVKPRFLKPAQGAFVEHFISKPEQNKDSPFGRLVQNDPHSSQLKDDMRDIYENGKIKKAYTHITEGKDLSSLWQRFQETANEMSHRYEYRPTLQNSNTFIAQVLKKNGFETELGVKDGGLSKDTFKDETLHLNTDPDGHIKLNIPGATRPPSNPIKPKPQSQKPEIKDVFEKYAEVMGNKDKADQSRLTSVAATKTKENVLPLLLSSTPVPDKGPERVDQDPAYNPFNRDKNGFEDLEGEVHIWKKDPLKKDQLIREAGREKDFGLDIDYDTEGRPLPKKGLERVKRDFGYNPFDVALNGEEDLEGEAFIWKTYPLKKDRLIRQAGRASFFGLEPA